MAEPAKNGKKVFVGMSGGVDSSVAALLLKNEGYDVVGVFLRCYNLDGCSERDAEDARRVAGHLGIPFYSWDFENEYRERVVGYMINGYRRGITPNPDVMCNREIKFGLFFDKALAMGADYVATGHYVKLRNADSANVRGFGGQKNKKNFASFAPNSHFSHRLCAANDKNKDQSYFLWTLTQKQLRHCFFPIGDYLKPEVREMARRAALPVAAKKDSQGICFLGKVAAGEFLKNHIASKRGAVLTAAGVKVGEHDGACFYTIGQRHIGLLRRDTQGSADKPLYVAAKDIALNTLTVAEGCDNPALYRKEIQLENINFINEYLISLIRANGGMEVAARVRYRQPLARAFLACDGQSEPASCKLVFDSPQKFVASGQSAVFYGEDGEMLGGGVICD